MSHVAARFLLLLVALNLIVQGCSESSFNLSNRDKSKAQSQRLEEAPLARTAAATIQPVGHIEPVALFNGPMPTGVAISRNGRLFVNFPRWGDDVEYTVAEMKDGKTLPFPDAEINNFHEGNQSDHLVSVQSVVIDPLDRLWILDTATINMGPTLSGGPKLLCVDLSSNKVVKRINFPDNVALRSTYLNDVRFDLNRRPAGTAFITDSGEKSPNGIIVVDLASGQSWRKLDNDPSVKADDNFTPTVEGEKLMVREPGKPPQPIKMASDGIAIDPHKGVLYYCPLGSHRIYSVSLDALANRDLPADQVAATIKPLPKRDFASDGLECTADGTLLLTDYEHNAIQRLTSDGKYQILVSDPRMIWPDTMSIGGNGYLYFTANQLNRQARFHDGRDLRHKPYVIFRTEIGSRPMAMR
jgi:sugar lactone lactonase YvrE